MNMFNGPKSIIRSQKKQVVRRETVQVKGNLSFQRSPLTSSGRVSQDRQEDTQSDGFAKKPLRKKRNLLNNLKRKQSEPGSSIFSDDDETEGSESFISDSDTSFKRIKSGYASDPVQPCMRRQLVWKEAYGQEKQELDYIHGATATCGPFATKFREPWDTPGASNVTLQYPSNSRGEQFHLKTPINDMNEYKPIEDVVNTIHHVICNYFPEPLQQKCLDSESGLQRRLVLAQHNRNVGDFVKALDEYNEMTADLLNSGVIEDVLTRTDAMHLEWVKHILNQIYARAVSPRVDSLKAYQNGSDNVYGELLPRLISEMFKRTQLQQKNVFLDLGSGVGNVVLQAALETGCESWGIEVMKNPCELAAAQAREFVARTRLWGLRVGTVHLLEGDMRAHAEIAKVLPRADVVLVNNQAFTSELNEALRILFLDLKVGARVISLKPFVPIGHRIAVRNLEDIANQFVQEEFTYFSDSVSWTDQGDGRWYLATKDLRPLNKFRRRMDIGN